MPFDPHMIPTRLIAAARYRNLVPLVGHGVSRQAADVFPNWLNLLETMMDHALRQHYLNPMKGKEVERLIHDGELDRAAEALRECFPIDEYFDLINQHFHPPGVQPAPVHKALVHLDAPLILTTNYDHLLEDAYAEVYRRSPTVYTYVRAEGVQRLSNEVISGTAHQYYSSCMAR